MQNRFSSACIGLIVGLLMGAGGAWGWMTLTAPPPEVPVENLVVKPARIVTVVDKQALYEANLQIEDLKRQLADEGKGFPDLEPKQPKVVRSEKKAVAGQAHDLGKPTRTPEQLAEEAAQRDARRQQFEERVTARNDFLAAIDTRQMNPDQRANHDKLLASVNRMNELRITLTDAKAPASTEMRKEIGKEMHELSHSMDDLYQEERMTLLETTGKNMGYTGDQVQLFAGQMKDIYEYTSSPRAMWGDRTGSRHGDSGNTTGKAAPRN